MVYYQYIEMKARIIFALANLKSTVEGKATELRSQKAFVGRSGKEQDCKVRRWQNMLSKLPRAAGVSQASSKNLR